MLRLLYMLFFIILAFIAIKNLIRNLVSFSVDGNQTHRQYDKGSYIYYSECRSSAPHPELLDDSGKLIKEPLLVMRSIDVEDARQQLDAMYNDSSAHKIENQEEI